MKFIRWLLGRIILLVDRLTAPKPMIRSPDAQAEADAQTRSLVLYQYLACPFCVKVRRAIRRLGLNIATCDAKNDAACKARLLTEGGKLQVPCLQITSEDGSVRWLYESDDIIRYLESRFADLH